MNQDLVLLGGGGHARVVLDALELLGLKTRVRGVLAPMMTDREQVGLPWLGGDEALAEFSPRETLLINGLGSVRGIGQRLALFDQNRALGFGFLSVIHPHAMVSAGAVVGEGVLVMVRGVVQTGAVLAENVLVNTGAIVEHDCRLESHVHVATGAVLCGGVSVGRASHIGAGAVVREGIVIGSGVVVGAGAVVVDDVRDGAVVVGCPAREIKR